MTPPSSRRSLGRRRTILVFLALLLCACAPQEERLTLPDRIGAWTKEGEQPIGAGETSDVLARLQLQSSARGIYGNSGARVSVTLHQMPNATAAFEAVQTYPRHADEFYFQKGATFVVLGLKELPMEARRPFLLAFQEATTPDGPEKKETE